MAATEALEETVAGRGAVAALVTTGHAAMDDHEFVADVLDGDGLHEGAAGRGPVARVDVDVLRPEAVGAVIRVAVTHDVPAADVAGEVLARAREAP